jgi:putative SbcD/Mre11-related phosphoesterase
MLVLHITYEIPCIVNLIAWRRLDFLSLNPAVPYPVLLLASGTERSLIFGDLHMGWEASLAEQGLHIPSQASKLLERLKTIIKETDPTRLIVLGDIKHTVTKVGLMEWRDIPAFFEALFEIVRRIDVIPGNHDGNLEALVPRGVNIHPVSGLTVDHEVGIIHGHAWPKPEILGCNTIVMGHLHPMITLTDTLGFSTTYQVWLRAASDGEVLAQHLLKHLGIRSESNVRASMKERFNVDLTDPYCIFLPSFNSLLSGQILNKVSRELRLGESYTGPLLRSNGIRIMDADVYLIDGIYLGKLKVLPATRKYT